MTVDETSLEFHDKSRSIKLTDNNRVCDKGSHETYGFVKGNQSYTSGVHNIRIKFEKIPSKTNSANDTDWSPWIFIGICSSAEKSAYGDVRYHKLRSACGWSTNGDVWMNGMGRRIHWSGTPIENDVMKLTIDCEHKSLTLFNERTLEKAKQILVDEHDKTLFPWSLYLVLANQGYRLRLL